MTTPLLSSFNNFKHFKVICKFIRAVVDVKRPASFAYRSYVLYFVTYLTVLMRDDVCYMHSGTSR